MPSGRSGARTSLMPTDDAIAFATRALSPDSMIVVLDAEASRASASAALASAAQRIGHAEHAEKRPSRQTIIVVWPSSSSSASTLVIARGQRVGLEHREVADAHRLAVDLALDALAVDRVALLRGERRGRRASVASVEHRLGERMTRQRSRGPPPSRASSVSATAVRRGDRDQLRLAVRQRAGLVERHGANRPSDSRWAPPLISTPPRAARDDRREHRRRRRDRERARRRRDDQRDAAKHRDVPRRPDEDQHDAAPRPRSTSTIGTKRRSRAAGRTAASSSCAPPPRPPCRRCAPAACRPTRLVTSTSIAASVLIVPANTFSPGPRGTGHGLAGDRRLVDQRLTLADHAVERHAIARLARPPLAERDLARRAPRPPDSPAVRARSSRSAGRAPRSSVARGPSRDARARGRA